MFTLMIRYLCPLFAGNHSLLSSVANAFGWIRM